MSKLNEDIHKYLGSIPDDLLTAPNGLLELVIRSQQRIKELESDYQELIVAVTSKYEGETRHQTALRYINQAEQGWSCGDDNYYTTKAEK